MVNLRQIILLGECLGENIRRGKIFVGEKYSSGKNIRRGKIFVGEKYTSGKNFVNCRKFRQFSPTNFSPIRYTL